MVFFRLFSKNANKREQNSFSVRSFGFSHMGKVRTSNQDAFLFNDLPGTSAPVMAVADGMGGHQGGEIASTQCIKIFANTLKDAFGDTWFWPKFWGDKPATTERSLESHILERALMTAHFAIRKLSFEDVELHDMGTTFTGLLIEGSTLHFVHAGDSRLYLFRDGELTQVTQDHRYDPVVSDTLLIPTELTSEYAVPNTLTKSVGDDTLSPDIGLVKLEPNDQLLLCTDGLTDMISNEHIRRILDVSHTSEKEKVQALLDAALKLGGRDNVTVVIGTCSELKKTKN